MSAASPAGAPSVLAARWLGWAGWPAPLVVSSKTRSSGLWPALLGELAPIDSADDDELDEAADDKLVPSDEPVDSTEAALARERSCSWWWWWA